MKILILMFAMLLNGMNFAMACDETSVGEAQELVKKAESDFAMGISPMSVISKAKIHLLEVKLCSAPSPKEDPNCAELVKALTELFPIVKNQYDNGSTVIDDVLKVHDKLVAARLLCKK